MIYRPDLGRRCGRRRTQGCPSLALHCPAKARSEQRQKAKACFLNSQDRCYFLFSIKARMSHNQNKDVLSIFILHLLDHIPLSLRSQSSKALGWELVPRLLLTRMAAGHWR